MKTFVFWFSICHFCVCTNTIWFYVEPEEIFHFTLKTNSNRIFCTGFHLYNNNWLFFWNKVSTRKSALSIYRETSYITEGKQKRGKSGYRRIKTAHTSKVYNSRTCAQMIINFSFDCRYSLYILYTSPSRISTKPKNFAQSNSRIHTLHTYHTYIYTLWKKALNHINRWVAKTSFSRISRAKIL